MQCFPNLKVKKMKRVFGTVLAASVLLAGCSPSSENEGAPSSEQPTQTTEAEKKFAQVGDAIPVDCQGNNCAGGLVVDEIQLGGDCKTRLVEEAIPDGFQLVQITGVLTAVEEIKDETGAEIGVSQENPVVWDSQQFKSTTEWGGGCDIPQGYEQWGVVPAKVGEKVRSYGTFLIADDAQVLGIANSKFDLKAITSAAEESTSSVAPSAAASPTEEAEQAPAVEQNTPVYESPAEAEAPVQAPAPAHQEAEPVIGYTEAPGQVEPQVMEKQIASCGDPSIHQTGTTFFTDGTTGWTENCAAQMM